MKYSALDIPPDTLMAINDYVLRGIPPGGFLEAVLEDRLVESFNRADIRNTEAMPHIVWYMYEIVPIQCRGSREAVSAWLSKGGLTEEPESLKFVEERMKRAMQVEP